MSQPSTPAQQYTRNPPLDEADLLPDPLAQLEAWIEAARAAGMIEPGAMTLATADAQGRPSARIVLFKGYKDGGVCFYTNYESHKGRDLAANPQAALVFWWDKLERQVRIEGRVEKLPREDAQRYFHSRFRDSQIGAVTSRQSEVVATRAELDARFEANAQALEGQPVPMPDFWGGYRLQPESIEFWQGRGGRLHDRLRYVALDGADAGRWKIERLEP